MASAAVARPPMASAPPPALHVAIANGRVDEARLLIDRGEIDRPGPDERTALQFACEEGQADAVRLLLDRGAVVDKFRFGLAGLRRSTLRLLDSLFPGEHSRGQPRLPDELFAIIVRYYWCGQP